MRKLTKYQRLKVYKQIRKDLIEEQEQREKHKDDYFHQKNRVNFCDLIFIFSMSVSFLFIDLTELYKHKPTIGWEINSMYWFEPLAIEPRLEIIEKVIKDFKVSFWDIIFRRV